MFLLEKSNDLLDTRVWTPGTSQAVITVLCRRMKYLTWGSADQDLSPRGLSCGTRSSKNCDTMRQTERKRLLPVLWPHLPVFVKGNMFTLMFLRYILSQTRRMCIQKRTREEGGLSVTHSSSYHTWTLRGRSDLSLLSHRQRCGSQDVANWVFRKPVTRFFPSKFASGSHWVFEK